MPTRPKAKPQDVVFTIANALAGAFDFLEGLEKGHPTLQAASRAYTKAQKRAAGLENAKQSNGFGRKPSPQYCPCGSGQSAAHCDEHIDAQGHNVTHLFCTCCGLPKSQCQKSRDSSRVG